MTRWHLLILTLVATLGGGSARAGAPAASIEPAVARIDAVHGRPLVFRVTLENERDARRPVTIRTDDGTDLEGHLFWISRAGTAEGPDTGWLGPRAPWRAIPGDQARRMDDRPPGSWHIVADMPIGVYGQGIWIGPARHPLAWMPDPHRLGVGTGPGGGQAAGMWAPTVAGDALASPPVVRAIEDLSRDPNERWRARLMTDGLRPAAELTGIAEGAGPVRPFTADDPNDESARALEAIAQVIEARWQVALARLWLIDPDLCTSVRTTAAGVAKFTDGSGHDVWAPAWDPSPLVVEDLLEDLLSPFVDDETRALRARAWLATQPRAVVWVFDDAGRQDALTGDLLPTLGIVSTPRRDAPALVAVEGTSRPNLDPAPPRELRVIGASVPVSDQPAGSARPAQVGVRIGPWRTEVGVLNTMIAARPPGVSAGPLLDDWNLPGWRLGRAFEGALPPAGARTNVLLTRRARPTGVESRSGWTLLVECRGEAAESDGENEPGEFVRVWIGAYGRPSAVLRVGRDGAVTDELAEASGRSGFGARAVPVADSGGSWAFEITLPPDAVGDDGVLRLGLDRTDGAGRHTGWPRRMLPWQNEPGRLAIDTTQWDALGE